MRCAAFLAALALAMAASSAADANVEIAPVTLDLSAAKPITSLRLRNTAAAPAAFVAEVFAWTQENGEDVLTPAPEIVVSPPAFVIPGEGAQIVRVGAPDAPKTARGAERAYRLVLTQTPLQSGEAQTGLRVRLQLSLPMFLAPTSANAPAPAPRVTIAGGGAARTVRIENPGARHIALTEVKTGGGAGGFPRYLLAGQAVERPAPSGASISVSYADSDSVEIKTKVFDFAPVLAARGASR